MLLSVTKGQAATLRFSVKDSTGAASDPQDMHVRVLRPPGTIDDYRYSDDELTRDGVGAYSLHLSFDEAGPWYVNATAEAPGQNAVCEDFVLVTSSRLP